MVARFMSALHRYDVGRTLPVLHSSALTTAQVALLEYVREARTVSAIANHLGLSRPATSQLTDRLAGKGLILRTEGTDDRRQRFVVLSPSGAALTDRIAAARAARFTDALSHLEPALAARLEETLADVVTALNRDPAGDSSGSLVSGRRRPKP